MLQGQAEQPVVNSTASWPHFMVDDLESEVHIIVKGTFIELVAPPLEQGRLRAQSDSWIISSPRGNQPEVGASVLAESQNAISDASTDLPSDPEDMAVMETPMWWPSAPNESLWGQQAVSPCMGEIFLPAAFTEAEGLADLWICADYDGVSLASLPFMYTNFVMPWEWMHDGNCPEGEVVEPTQTECGTFGAACNDAFADVVEAPVKTTVLLRNLPTGYTRDELLELLEDEGLDGAFDFVYVPMDFGLHACLGYAFVNFVAASDAQRCWQIFDGLTEWGRQSDKACEVMWGEPCQGFEAHVERYRNSPVMHPSVPEAWKPAIFRDGARVPFPGPTKAISAPKVRRRTHKEEGR